MFELYFSNRKKNLGLNDIKISIGLNNLSINLEKVTEYYGGVDATVVKPNLLVKLVNELNIDLNADPMDVYESLVDTSIYLAGHLGFSTPKKDGKWFYDNLIKGTDEIFIYTDEELEVNEFNYKTVKSMRNVYNTYNGLLLTHPTKVRGLDKEDSLFIYEVNLPAVGMQYYYWAKNNILNDRSIDISKFVYNILFTNVIDSILNISLVNRLLKIMKGEEVRDYIEFNPFPLPNINKNLDKLYKRHLDKLSKKPLYYPDFLFNLPVINTNGFETLKFNMIDYNRHIEWVVWLCRLKISLDIIDTLGVKSSRLNRDDIEELKILYKFAYKDNRFSRIEENKNYSEVFKDLTKNIKGL